MRILKALALLFMLCLAGVAFDATAASTPAPKRNYVEVELTKDTSEKDAVAIATKVLADDISMAEQMASGDVNVYARFISLGPDQPKTSIVAMISHIAWCGSSGCLIKVLQPTGKDNTYRQVFDTTAQRFFLHQRAGKPYTDFLTVVGPRASDGFGVWFWDDAKKEYTFAGRSKFAQ